MYILNYQLNSSTYYTIQQRHHQQSTLKETLFRIVYFRL